MNEKMAMKLSAVITRRQEEMKLFSEKNLKAGQRRSAKRTRENLFVRILNYFASKE